MAPSEIRRALKQINEEDKREHHETFEPTRTHNNTLKTRRRRRKKRMTRGATSKISHGTTKGMCFSSEGEEEEGQVALFFFKNKKILKSCDGNCVRDQEEV